MDRIFNPIDTEIEVRDNGCMTTKSLREIYENFIAEQKPKAISLIREKIEFIYDKLYEKTNHGVIYLFDELSNDCFINYIFIKNYSNFSEIKANINFFEIRDRDINIEELDLNQIIKAIELLERWIIGYSPQ